MIKYFVITLAFLSIAIYISGEPVSIQGKWNNNNDKVVLYNVRNGTINSVSTFNLQEDKSFGFLFNSSHEEFYVIGDDNQSSQLNKFVFYLKPGDNLNVEINEDSYLLVGDNNSIENQKMYDWFEKSKHLRMFVFNNSQINTTYEDFFNSIKDYYEINDSQNVADDDTFNSKMQSFKKLDILNLASAYVFTPHKAMPEFSAFPDFYKNIDIGSITSTAFIMSHPYGIQMLKHLIYLKSLTNGDTKLPSIEEQLGMIEDNTVKGEYLLNHIKSINNYDDFQKYTSLNEKYLLTDRQKNIEESIRKKLVDLSESKIINEDTLLTDPDGKKVSLSEYLGKVVYIDLWATWCGPCKQELPHFVRAHNNFVGKEVVFIGISLDEEKDFQKWKKYVEDNKLPGVQLFAGGYDNSLTRFFKVDGIPRFILIDKDGRVIEDHAPRPSNIKLYQRINEELMN